MYDDRDIIEAVFEQDAELALYYAGEEMKSDYEFNKRCIEKSGFAIKYANMKYRESRDLVELALK